MVLSHELSKRSSRRGRATSDGAADGCPKRLPSFVGHAGLVEASDGVECQAETGELEAMQIILHPHQ